MSKIENIKVAVRVRPLNKNEINENASEIISLEQNHEIPEGKIINILDPVSKKSKEFAFDYVFDKNTTNRDIYNSIGTNIVDSALAGYNCCVLAYGQTGSGKTYTMLNYGSDSVEEHGLIPQIAGALIARSNSKPNYEIQMEASFIEIYAEKIFDLLCSTSSNVKRNDLKLHINPKVGTYVEDLTSVAVTNTGEIMKLIDKGFKHRSTSSTAMNEQSSRSHAIFTITFKQITYSNTGENRKIVSSKISKINLVDLAGSERVKTSKVSGVGFQEAIAINKSLSMLSTVFNDLVDTGTCNKFRSSVLTSLLADSISGRSKTVVIANISPASIQYEISMQTLFYVYRTKKIAVNATINEVKGEDTSIITQQYKQEIERLKEELEEAKRSNNSQIIERLKSELLEYEKLYNESTQTWNDKLQESYNVIQSLESNLRESKTSLNQEVQLLTNEITVLTHQLTETQNKLLQKEKQDEIIQNGLKKLINIFKV